MAFSAEWEHIHQEREWGRYPKEELVRWVARTYYAVSDRSLVKFLDLGSGAGASTWFLEREGFDVTALDGSKAAISRIISKGVVADAVALPFEAETFDCVVDIICIAHNTASDAQKIVAEVRRVLKPQGKFFSMMPTSSTWRQLYEGKGNIIFPSKGQVMELLKPHFNIQINWSAFSDNGNVLEHWLITGDVK